MAYHKRAPGGAALLRDAISIRALTAGCVVESVIHTYAYERYAHQREIETRLRINDHICLLSSVRTLSPSAQGLGGYVAYAYSTLRSVDAVVCTLDIPEHPRSVFIFPSADLITVGFAGNDQRVRARFFIPVQSAGNQTAFDPWHYENAWHLLSKEEETKTAA